MPDKVIYDRVLTREEIEEHYKAALEADNFSVEAGHLGWVKFADQWRHVLWVRKDGQDRVYVDGKLYLPAEEPTMPDTPDLVIVPAGCIKCGAPFGFLEADPEYQHDPDTFGERLLFSCRRCGYVVVRPVASEEPDDA